MSLKPSSSPAETRSSTEPFTELNSGRALQPTLSSAFPKNITYKGWLDVRRKRKRDWKRRFFVLSNNFLLYAATPYAKNLEGVIALEGSNVQNTTKTSDVSFEIIARHKRSFFRAGSPAECNQWTVHIEQASTLKIKDLYRFTHTLGASESQNTKVVAATHRVTGTDSAIKIINKKTCNRRMLSNEVQILKRLDSEYVVKLYDLFENKNYLYLVMERCEGGELFEAIAALDGGHFDEKICHSIIHQIATGVKYMHRHGIVHRDLKPENILCTRTDSVEEVKIADFGISKITTPTNQQMSTMCGTLSYTAPEVLRREKYTSSVDCWSIGVIMYILLCGYPPFYGENDLEIQQSILNDEVEIDPEDWEHVSPQAKDLVLGLLEKKAKDRATLDDILRQTWIGSHRNGFPDRVRNQFIKTVVKRRMLRYSTGSMYKQNFDDHSVPSSSSRPSPLSSYMDVPRNIRSRAPGVASQKRRSRDAEDIQYGNQNQKLSSLQVTSSKIPRHTVVL